MLSFNSRDDASHWVSLLEGLEPASLANDASAQGYAREDVLDRLLEESEAATRDNPARAERLGLIAIVLSGRLDEGEGWLPPGLVRACTAVGAARRLQGKRRQAEASFERASVLLNGSLEEATFSRELALLRWEQGRTCEATALLRQSAALFVDAALDVPEVECLGLLGILALEENRPEQALGPLLRAHSALGSCRRPPLLLAVRSSLALCHARLGSRSEAHLALEGARRLLPSLEGNAEALVAFDWVEGQTAHSLGDWGRAEPLLTRAFEKLLGGGRLGEATLATLDLAHLAAERGELDDLPTLVDELASQFRGCAELPLALQALCAFEEEVLTPGADLAVSAAGTARFVRQTFRSQGLRVQPPPYP